jgi:hypothetical protein
MGSMVGDLAQRAKRTFNEDAQGVKQAYRAWKDSPSWYQVTRHQFGLDRKSGQKRPAAKRTTSSRKSKSSGR